MNAFNKIIIVAVLLIGRADIAMGQQNSTEHKYVDLGLPSGTLWATCNLGANTPEGYGDYFAWGETKPKEVYNWSTYKYCKGYADLLTKYCGLSSYSSKGCTDYLSSLLSCDDAATANWGEEWCMPTETQWVELTRNTSVSEKIINGVQVLCFTGRNGNRLFLPASGSRSDAKRPVVGKDYTYWLSNVCVERPTCALNYHRLVDISFSTGLYIERCAGLPIRPVRSGKTTKPNTNERNNNYASSSAERGQKVYSNAYDGFLNIRQAPNGGAPILGVLKNGPDGAILLGSEGEWKKIDYHGIVGYVYGKYVQFTPTAVFKGE